MSETSLNIIFLNVKHGDSIILEYLSDGESHYGVIDSNIVDGEIPAKTYLNKKGVEELSFIALTHLHSDHYQGLAELLREFRVDKILLTPNLGNDFKDFVDKKLPLFKRAIKKLADNSDSTIDYTITSLLKFLVELKKKSEEDCLIMCGPDNNLFLNGFSPSVSISILQPLAYYKGVAFNKLERGEFSTESLDANDLSLAFKVDFGGVRVLLSGDSPQKAWERLGRYRKNNSLESNIVKLSHHGSAYDNDVNTLTFQYGNSTGIRVATISANGSSHPATAVLESLKNLKVEPYCTNMAESCYQQISKNDFSNANKLDQSLKEMLYLYDTFRKGIPCQGDITFTITASGQFSVKTEKSMFCPNRAF